MCHHPLPYFPPLSFLFSPFSVSFADPGNEDADEPCEKKKYNHHWQYQAGFAGCVRSSSARNVTGFHRAAHVPTLPPAFEISRDGSGFPSRRGERPWHRFAPTKEAAQGEKRGFLLDPCPKQTPQADRGPQHGRKPPSWLRRCQGRCGNALTSNNPASVSTRPARTPGNAK